MPSSKLGQVRLDNLADINRGTGPARIERLNRQFQVGVNANLNPGVALDEGARLSSEAVARINLPPAYKFQFLGRSRYWRRRPPT